MRTSSIVPSKLASLSKVCSSRADSQRVLSTVRSGSDHVIFQADASQTPRAVPNGESTFVDADRILSVRLQGDALSSSGKHLEFLVKLRNSSSAWLPATAISEDLRRDYEISWWSACRTGHGALVERVRSGGELLVHARDTQMRSGLHYACGTGDVEAVALLLENGAEVDVVDDAGYSPLHIAAGYLHEKVIATLMNAGADPSLEDNSGRSPLTLVETLLRNTPATTALFSKRLALEAVSTSLRNFMFEEIVPEAILQKRVHNSRVQFLVTWFDGFEPMWVDDIDIADDLIRDFECGLERATVLSTFGSENLPTSASNSLVQWADTDLLSWSESTWKASNS